MHDRLCVMGVTDRSQSKRFLGRLVSDCIRACFFFNTGLAHKPLVAKLFRPVSRYTLAFVCATIHYYCQEWERGHSGRRHAVTGVLRDLPINHKSVEDLYQGKQGLLAKYAGGQVDVLTPTLTKLTAAVTHGTEKIQAEGLYQEPKGIDQYANSLSGLVDFEVDAPNGTGADEGGHSNPYPNLDPDLDPNPDPSLDVGRHLNSESSISCQLPDTDMRNSPVATG